MKIEPAASIEGAVGKLREALAASATAGMAATRQYLSLFTSRMINLPSSLRRLITHYPHCDHFAANGTLSDIARYCSI